MTEKTHQCIIYFYYLGELSYIEPTETKRTAELHLELHPSGYKRKTLTDSNSLWIEKHPYQGVIRSTARIKSVEIVKERNVLDRQRKWNSKKPLPEKCPVCKGYISFDNFYVDKKKDGAVLKHNGCRVGGMCVIGPKEEYQYP